MGFTIPHSSSFPVSPDSLPPSPLPTISHAHTRPHSLDTPMHARAHKMLACHGWRHAVQAAYRDLSAASELCPDSKGCEQISAELANLSSAVVAAGEECA